MGSLIHEPSTDFHLKLNEQLFHIPHELLRKNVRQVHKLIERESSTLQSLFSELNVSLQANSLDQDKLALNKLNEIIRKVDLFERKLTKRVDEELRLLERIDSRLKFFHGLQNAKESQDVSKLTDWYQKYTNVLIADYLIRNDQVHLNSLQDDEDSVTLQDGKMWNPGVTYLKQQQLESLLDYDILLAANRISKSLTVDHNLEPLLHWIGENKVFLKKNRSFLEFEARLQDYVELLKAGDYKSAIGRFQKFLLPFVESNYSDLKLASGLLVFINSCRQEESKLQVNDSIDPQIITNDENNTEPNLRSKDDIYEHFFRKKVAKRTSTPPTVNKVIFKRYNKNADLARYTDLLDQKRWSTLNELFSKEYYSMYGISHKEPLLMYLSLGISTLKTKECLHRKEFVSSDNPKLDEYLQKDVLGTTCPVCSEEFAPIAKDLPYAHHIQSKLFENPVMLPNGNIYDAKKLKALALNLNRSNLADLQEFEVVDPIDKKKYPETDFIKMYPT